MDHSDLLESLLYTTRHGAGFILRRMGRIPPAAVYFTNPDDPLVDFYFPKEDAPRATDDELMALVQEAMREVAARPETCAIAVATEIARDGQRFMAVQAETRQEAVVLHFPLRRRLWWRVLGESEQVEGLLAQRLFAGEPHGEAG